MSLHFDPTWRYVLQADYELRFNNYLGIAFESEWFRINGDMLYIRKGYAWNGCDPAYRVEMGFLGIDFWIGTPDGHSLPNGLRQTWEASLVHDAFCQYRTNLVGVSKKFTVDLFHELLVKAGFETWRAKLYARVVSALGPQDWK